MSHDDATAAHLYLDHPFSRPLTPAADLVTRLDHWVETRPDATYLVVVGRDGAERSLTFGELDRHSRGLAAWLRRSLELRPGDVVALLPRNDLRSVVTIFALLRSGCTTFFINPAERAERRSELLAAVPTKALLAPTPEVAEQHPVTATIPALDELPARGEPMDEPSLEPGAAAFMFGTSGSTATSKLVAQAHYNAAINAEALRRHHRLGPDVRILGCLPIHHVNGLHFTLMATLWAGAEAVLLDSFDTRGYPRALTEYRPAIASVVPSILETLLLTWRDPRLPSTLRYFVSAAAALSARTSAAVHDRLGARVHQGYGLTETTNFSATMPTGLSDADYRRIMLDVDIPSIGVEVYGNEMAVLRPDGSRADDGEIGELCMRGHNVMLGYYRNEAATAEAFRGGWFHSQDLGYARRDEATGHTFFHITGRSKNMAKVMGIAVSFEEMERVLMRLPAVRDAACFSIPDELAGELVVAVVVGDDLPGRRALTEHLGGYFDSMVVPRHVVAADSIPRTATGKLIRGQLPARFAPGGKGS